MRVVVAMSGGVDSSVVAGLLHEAGHEVIGVTLQLYDHGAATGRKGACCAGQDIHDARRVADRLGIPHYVIDAEARFAARGDRRFRRQLRGRRDAGALRPLQPDGEVRRPGRRWPRDLGAERLATGHYVRRVDGPDGAGTAPRRRSGARPELVPVRDRRRRSLEFSLFPLGEHGGQGARCAPRPRGSGWRSPTSRTARTSASCPPATMPMWSRSCGPMRCCRARSSTRTGAWSAGTTASARYTVGQASGWAMRRRSDGARQVVLATRTGAAARGRRAARDAAPRIGAAARGELADPAARSRCAAR